MKFYVSEIPNDYYVKHFDDYCVAKIEGLIGNKTWTIKYSDISSLGWNSLKTWAKSAQNRVYYRLTIIKFNNEVIRLDGCYIDVLFNSYKTLAKLTFNRRLQGYLDQIKNNGYFVYDSYSFSQNGEIKKNSNSFDIHSATFPQNDSLTLKIKRVNAGLISSILQTSTINLEIDKDIFMLLFEKIKNNMIITLVEESEKEASEKRAKKEEEERAKKEEEETNRKRYNDEHKYEKQSQASHLPPEILDLLKFFDLSSDCESEDIKKAYRKKISQYHPDKVSHLAPEYKIIAEEKSKEINKNYKILMQWKKE